MKNELYFCLKLTSDEHDIVEDMIRKYCILNHYTLKYYRILKDGHIPMYRECKVVGNIGDIKDWLNREKISDNVERNPHKVDMPH